LSRLVSSKAPPEGSAGSRFLISIGILVAVAMDVAVVFAVMALASIEISLAVLAALLTIIGYSVNDSVVLWGHVQNRQARLKQDGRILAPEDIVTGSVDDVLSRAVLTSLTTIVPAIAVLLVGIKPLESFAWVIITGGVAGTLSSMFVVGSFAVAALRRDERPTAPPTPPDEAGGAPMAPRLEEVRQALTRVEE
jgi:preprotein translocase subunit SecF